MLNEYLQFSSSSFSDKTEKFDIVVVGAGGGGIWPLSYGEWLKNHTKGGGVFTFGLR